MADLDLAKLFAGMKGKKVNDRGDFDKLGCYWARLDKHEIFSTRKEKTQVMIRKTIIKIIDDGEGAGHKLGDSAVTGITRDEPEMFLEKNKAYIACAMGMDKEAAVDEIGEEEAVQVFSHPYLFKSRVVEFAGRKHKTQKGNNIIICDWRRLVSDEEVLGTLPQEHIDRFFPNGTLEERIAAKAAGQ